MNKKLHIGLDEVENIEVMANELSIPVASELSNLEILLGGKDPPSDNFKARQAWASSSCSTIDSSSIGAQYGPPGSLNLVPRKMAAGPSEARQT